MLHPATKRYTNDYQYLRHRQDFVTDRIVSPFSDDLQERFSFVNFLKVDKALGGYISRNHSKSILSKGFSIGICLILQ